METVINHPQGEFTDKEAKLPDDSPAETPQTKVLSIEDARANIAGLERQLTPNATIEDDAYNESERQILLDRIKEYVDSLNKAVFANGQKIVEQIWVENNKIDTKLVELILKIPVDNFSIDGVYEITMLKKTLSEVCHNMPLFVPGNTEDVNFKARQKAEQKLVRMDLSDKVGGREPTQDNMPATVLDEVSQEFVSQNTPGVEQLKGSQRFFRAVKKTFKLVS